MTQLHQDIFGRKHLHKMIENHLNSYVGIPSVKFYINAIHNYFRDLDSTIYNCCLHADTSKINKLEHIASINGVNRDGLSLYAGSLMRTKFATMYMSQGKLKMCRLVNDTLRMPHDVYKVEDQYDLPRIILKELPRLIPLASKLTGVNPLLNRSACYIKPGHWQQTDYGMVTIGQYQVSIVSVSEKNVYEVRVEHMMSHAKFTDKMLIDRTAIVTNILKAFKVMPVIKDADLLVDNSNKASIFIEFSNNTKEEKPIGNLDAMYEEKSKLRDETKARLEELNEEKDRLKTVYNDTVNWLIKADQIKSLTDELLRG